MLGGLGGLRGALRCERLSNPLGWWPDDGVGTKLELAQAHGTPP